MREHERQPYRLDYIILKDGPYTLTTQFGKLCMFSNTVPITWRTIKEYENDKGLKPHLLRRLRGKQILEVGPGLAELIPTIALSDEYPKPVIIDPIDYHTVGGLFERAINTGLTPPDETTARTLIDRTHILTSDRVKHYKMTLKQAYEMDLWLAHSADVVIDICAATHYAENFKVTQWIEQEYLPKVPKTVR